MNANNYIIYFKNKEESGIENIMSQMNVLVLVSVDMAKKMSGPCKQAKESTAKWICECAFRFSNSMNGWMNSKLIFHNNSWAKRERKKTTHISRLSTQRMSSRGCEHGSKTRPRPQITNKQIVQRRTKWNTKQNKKIVCVAHHNSEPADSWRKQFDKYLYYKSNALLASTGFAFCSFDHWTEHTHTHRKKQTLQRLVFPFEACQPTTIVRGPRILHTCARQRSLN